MVGSLVLLTTPWTNSAIQMKALRGKKVSFDKVFKMVDYGDATLQGTSGWWQQEGHVWDIDWQGWRWHADLWCHHLRFGEVHWRHHERDCNYHWWVCSHGHKEFEKDAAEQVDMHKEININSIIWTSWCVRGAIQFFHCTLLHAVVRCLFLSVACLPFGFRQCMLSCGGQRHFVFVFCIFACCADYFGLIGVLCWSFQEYRKANLRFHAKYLSCTHSYTSAVVWVRFLQLFNDVLRIVFVCFCLPSALFCLPLDFFRWSFCCLHGQRLLWVGYWCVARLSSAVSCIGPALDCAASCSARTELFVHLSCAVQWACLLNSNC